MGNIQIVFLLPKSCLCFTTRCCLEYWYAGAYVSTVRGFGRNRQWPRQHSQGITNTCQVSPKTVGSTALCFFRILEGLAYCTEYLEYAPLRVSPSCWALGLGLSWIPGNILIFFPGSDTMKQCKSCIISLTAHCNSQFVTWHKEFVLHALKMT